MCICHWFLYSLYSSLHERLEQIKSFPAGTLNGSRKKLSGGSSDSSVKDKGLEKKCEFKRGLTDERFKGLCCLRASEESCQP